MNALRKSIFQNWTEKVFLFFKTIFRKGSLVLKNHEPKKIKSNDELEDFPQAESHYFNEKTYFEKARSWADDLYSAAVTGRDRYFLAFMISMGLTIVLALVVLIALFDPSSDVVVVHESAGGYTWLSALHSKEVPALEWNREASEIAHYIRMRESYDPLFYEHQANEVKTESNAEVQSEYDLAQSSENKNAPINVLGAKGYRTITINNVLPLDAVGHPGNTKNPEAPVAQVDFVTVDHFFGQAQTIETPYTALVSWRYLGVPTDPEKKLEDWDGFQITKYVVEPVNVDTKN